MPGHVKRGGTGDPDPDPSPFLLVSYEDHQKDLAKPYDPKRSCWVPLKEGGFIEGMIDSTEGDKVTVKVNTGAEKDEKRVLKKDQVQQVNPPKFEKCQDMSNLTYLNEASVLHNLNARYQAKLIYTYSGLFCVAVNPYKRYPIYTETVVRMFVNKRRNEVPPHIFSIADGAYQSMLNHSKNQSILITGESGAGKTENTKKVIGYFASVGATGKASTGKASLEDQVVQTNPILEAFGNAKTVRNDNSSRFGKFIRIHFNQGGKLSGADMEVYLLEKSRITYQTQNERCFHIFYNLMSDAVKDLKRNCLLSNNIKDYHFVSQGKVSVESIDDKEDMQFADEAFDILGFTKEEKYNIYKVTACVMHLGEMKFKQKSSKDDQASPDGTDAGKKVATLLGTDTDLLYDNFVRPKIKVGAEWVIKGQNTAQANNSVAGIARAIFERQFRYLVSKCNETLVDPTMRRISFIGVLDIAGFEIFEFNGFEQMCINFCNEKLQQFFNHHMFVLEQEEYMREGIEWAMVDFGMDLQKCIDMFEKPMGLLSILEEESLFPKATDKTFEEKLMANHLGKSACFQKPKPGDKDAHFAIMHYAGTVSYNLTNWLEKNKDPLNDSVVDQFKNASNKLIVEIFADHPGQSGEDAKDASGGKKRKGGGKTVSSFYKEQLNNLMTTLHATEPHFIRCIVPNNNKLPGVLDANLVMHQLTCNGVLEGIRICRKGFPNRMVYEDFKQRYGVLNVEGVQAAMRIPLGSRQGDTEKRDRAMAKAVLDKLGMEPEKYRLGYTKVFFRAGVLGLMEEIREEKIGEILSWLQAAARGKMARQTFKKLKSQKLALYCIQRTIRNFMIGKTWLWWQLWLKVKPQLRSAKFAEIKAALEAKTAEAEKKKDQEKQARQKASAMNDQLKAEKAELEETLARGDNVVKEMEEKVKKLESEKKELDKQANEVSRKLMEEEELCNSVANSIKKYDSDVKKLNEDIQSMEFKLQQCEEDKTTKDSQIRSLKEEFTHQEELVAKLQKEKRQWADGRQQKEEALQAAEDKANHLNRIKAKLEQNLDELEDSVEREKKARNELEKSKRKLEGDLRCSREAVAELERNKSELAQSCQRKEKELAAVAAKIEDEQSVGIKMQKQVKELACRLEELEEELESERVNRGKAERTRQALSRELEELGERLEESGNATATQIELNRKREAELAKLKEELDNSSLQHENALANMRQKHNSVISNLAEQIDVLNKAKAKVDQQKNSLMMDLNDVRTSVEELQMEKASMEKQNKVLHGDLSDASQRLDDLQSALNEADMTKKRLAIEKADLDKHLNDGENNLRNLSKLRTSLNTQLEDTKRLADAEARDRASLLGKFRSLESDLERLREKIEAENEAKGEIQKSMSRAIAEAQIWKSKYTTEAVARIEDLENARAKLLARIGEAEECIDGLTSKVQTTEKIRNRYQIDMEDIQSEYERVNTQVAVAEKKLVTFDKVVDEWRLKCEDLSSELDSSQRDCRKQSSDLFRLRAAWDETIEQLDSVRRENKNLGEEIKDLLDQLGEGGRSIHELDKQRRRLQVEKDELQAALEEAEAALEHEENKVLRAQLEVAQARQDIERKLQEKDEEFENTRKNFQRALDSMQASLEAETKAKEEAMRIKKKIEANINELEIALDHANKANAEATKQIKRLAGNLLEVDTAVEEECRARADIEDQLATAERKGTALASELDEARLLLETAERSRRHAEADVAEVRDAINELTSLNAMLTAEKRRLDGEIRGMQQEMDNLVIQMKNSEEKARKAMTDAGRLADELRSEQDHGLASDRATKAMAAQCVELQARLEDVETTALRHGKKIISKLEERLRFLESEYAVTQVRSVETHKAAVRSDRRIKEMEFTSDENKKNLERMSELVDKLQGKIRTFKKQIEDAEEIAALNLAKFRKAQQQLEEAEERSKNAETQMIRLSAGERNGPGGSLLHY